MRLKLNFLIITFSILITQLNAQDCWQKPSGDNKIANDYFSYGMYPCALQEYLYIYANKPDNKKLNHRIAQCYLLSPGANKSLAIKYLEFLIKDGKPDNDAYFELGQAYLYDGNFDKSIANFKKYIEVANPNGEALVNVEKHIEYATVSKELVKYPVNVTFKNLGEDVNSEYNEKHPFVTDEEDFIFLTSDRKGARGGIEDRDGYVPDVMQTKVKNGRDAYKGTRSLPGSFNTEFAEMVAGGSPDGAYFIYATDEQFQNWELKMAYKEEGKRSYPNAEFIESINGRNSHEIAATITNDGSLMIFSSDRKGGFGGFDLWMSKLLPTGTWGEPINMGPTINTEFDETYPNFSKDQSYITFSSNGLKGMGGFDLFKTEFSEDLKTWTKPKNLGYPINTAYDDNTITFVKNGRYAYKSCIRGDSYGMRDLYLLTFNDVLPTYTVVKSEVKADTLTDMGKLTQTINVNISSSKKLLDSLTTIGTDSAMIDSVKQVYYAEMGRLDMLDPMTNNYVEVYTDNGELYGQYTPNARNGKFIMILEPGIYDVSVSNEGFEPVKQRIRIYDKSNYTPELSRDFYLKPKANL